MILPLMMPAIAMIQAIALDGTVMILVTAPQAIIIILLTNTTLRMMQMMLHFPTFWMLQACLILVTVKL